MKLTETFCKRALLKKVGENELEEWVRRNPVPIQFIGGKYAHAYMYMNIGGFHTWVRKNILGYKI
jgi:hypothetical protein